MICQRKENCFINCCLEWQGDDDVASIVVNQVIITVILIRNINCKLFSESFMMKHQQQKHFGAEANFKGKVKCQFQDCLSRQVAEGVYLTMNKTFVGNKFILLLPFCNFRSEGLGPHNSTLWPRILHSVNYVYNNWFEQSACYSGPNLGRPIFFFFFLSPSLLSPSVTLLQEGVVVCLWAPK